MLGAGADDDVLSNAVLTGTPLGFLESIPLVSEVAENIVYHFQLWSMGLVGASSIQAS